MSSEENLRNDFVDSDSMIKMNFYGQFQKHANFPSGEFESKYFDKLVSSYYDSTIG